jgi:hypothetical protein
MTRTDTAWCSGQSVRAREPRWWTPLGRHCGTVPYGAGVGGWSRVRGMVQVWEGRRRVREGRVQWRPLGLEVC